tara:strand:- start:1785 stop:2024 length:240 start_codon:yes stop_codon:yes gene_type:complete
MNKKFMTPIDKEVAKIMKARTRFAVVAVFNDLVKELQETDRQIENMPEGEEKEMLLKSQKESWDLLMSDQMCGTIIVEA